MSNYPSTIITDLDGTLIRHQREPYDEPMIPLPEALEISYRWLVSNCKVIILTGRAEQFRDITAEGLKYCGFNYDQLVMGVTSGTRYLINDVKPYEPHFKTAVAINLERDEGFEKYKNWWRREG